jgi:hypothetical protein
MKNVRDSNGYSSVVCVRVREGGPLCFLSRGVAKTRNISNPDYEDGTIDFKSAQFSEDWFRIGGLEI